MERGNEADNPPGICHKLFNYLAESFPLYNLKQSNQGREDKVTIRPATGPELVPALDVPVEHLEVIFPKSSVSEGVRRRKDDSETTKEPGFHGTGFVEVIRLGQKSGEDLKKPSAAQLQENDPQAKILSPRKPIMMQISNINEKSDLFIKRKRESFVSQQ